MELARSTERNSVVTREPYLGAADGRSAPSKAAGIPFSTLFPSSRSSYSSQFIFATSSNEQRARCFLIDTRLGSQESGTKAMSGPAPPGSPWPSSPLYHTHERLTGGAAECFAFSSGQTNQAGPLVRHIRPDQPNPTRPDPNQPLPSSRTGWAGGQPFPLANM